MPASVRTMPVASDAGLRCLESSLTAGFDVSKAVLSAGSLPHGRFLTFVPAEMPDDAIAFPDTPDIPGSVADKGLANLLDELGRQGAMSIVVEDDLASPNDPGVQRWSVPSAFLGNRLIHWFDLEQESSADTVDQMGRYCISHVLNAFVCAASVTSLGLIDRQAVPNDLAVKVTASLLAVIVFAFDETSFAVWTDSNAVTPNPPP